MSLDWWAVIFNPSFPYRLTHMLLASGLTVSFLIAGLSALRYLAGDRSESMWKALRTGVFTAAILIPLQIFAGDQHGLNTLEHQPQKIAAMEANWQTRRRRAAGAVRHPRTRRAQENLFEIAHPQRRQPDPDAQPRRRRARPRRLSRQPSAGLPGVLGLPHHGRHRPADARRVLDRGLVPVAAPALPRPLALCCWCRWRCRAGSRRWPAGTPPRSAASPGWSPAC